MQKGACRYRRMESVRLGRGRVWPSIIQVNQWGPICWPKGFFSWLWRASRSTANWVRLMAAATLLVASWAVDQVCRLFSFLFHFNGTEWQNANRWQATFRRMRSMERADGSHAPDVICWCRGSRLSRKWPTCQTFSVHPAAANGTNGWEGPARREREFERVGRGLGGQARRQMPIKRVAIGRRDFVSCCLFAVPPTQCAIFVWPLSSTAVVE